MTEPEAPAFWLAVCAPARPAPTRTQSMATVAITGSATTRFAVLRRIDRHPALCRKCLILEQLLTASRALFSRPAASLSRDRPLRQRQGALKSGASVVRLAYPGGWGLGVGGW